MPNTRPANCSKPLRPLFQRLSAAHGAAALHPARPPEKTPGGTASLLASLTGRGVRAHLFAPQAKCGGIAALTTALAILFFLLIYGPAALSPTWDSWIFGGYIGVDILQHYAGWAAFRAADWALPLTFTPLLSWPFGGAASLADCIPAAALLAKLFSPVLPATFQYFGWFVLLCMMAMGWFSAKLLALFGLSAPAQVVGACLFITSPVMLERAFQHTALAAQFLVVAALYLYFRVVLPPGGTAPLLAPLTGRGGGLPNVPTAVAPKVTAVARGGVRAHLFAPQAKCGGIAALALLFVPLAALTAAIHLYLVPMVLAIAFAACVDTMTKQRAAVPRRHRLLPLLWLAASVAAALATALLLGFFAPVPYVPGGFGNFGANLNTFWNPASNNWAPWAPGYQNLLWSRLLPQRTVVGDSLDSFTYLGLGVLLGLLAAGIAALVRLCQSGALRQPGRGALLARITGLAKSHAGLLFSCLCLGLFAVSNRVTANSRILLEIPLPDAILRLCDTFRASGRMLWPLYYLLLLLCVVGVYRAPLAGWHLPKRASGAAGKADAHAAGAAAAAKPEAANPASPAGRSAKAGAPHGAGAAFACAADAAPTPHTPNRAARPAATLLLLLVLAVQLWDLSPALAQKHADFNTPPAPSVAIPPENWARVAAPGRVLYLLEPTEDRPTALRAALAGMPSNFFLLARGDTAALAAHMDATRASLLAGDIPYPNAAYFTRDTALAAQLAQSLGPRCQSFACAGYTVFLPV